MSLMLDGVLMWPKREDGLLRLLEDSLLVTQSQIGCLTFWQKQGLTESTKFNGIIVRS